MTDPAELLDAHRERLTGLRLESGYSDDEFRQYIRQPLLECARFVHQLPASRVETHRERGGLFRLAFETACLAFRRADVRLFDGSLRAGASAAYTDKAWRYSAFITGLCTPMGRASNLVAVHSPDVAHSWNPYGTGLWRWAAEHKLDCYTIEWRRGQDARGPHLDSVWIAARILGSDVVNRLRVGEGAVVEAMIDTLSGRTDNALSALIAESTHSVVDVDLAAARQGSDLPTVGVRVEQRLVDAMRGLVRDKWTCNTAGSRVWVTEHGVFLNWRPAVNDILVRLRSDGVSGLPNDPDTIAELLVEQAILAINPRPTSAAALTHYFRLVIQAAKIPKHPMDCVQLVRASLLGLQLDTVIPLKVIISGWPEERDAGGARRQAEFDLGEAAPATDVVPSGLSIEAPQTVCKPSSGEDAKPITARSSAPPAQQSPPPLTRYGAAGRTLAALMSESEAVFFPVEDGIAVAFPEAITGINERPRDFLRSCQAQSLIVPEGGDAKRLIRKRRTNDGSLPRQYIVLAQRLAPSLGLIDTMP